MLKKFRKLLCKIFGHRSIMLAFGTTTRDEQPWSTFSAHVCERCDHQTTNQWDY
jgi:hypothetical protein